MPWRVLEKQHLKKFMENIKAIKKYHIFKNIEEKDISALLRCLHARIIHIKKGITFIKRQEKINYIYLIVNGTARDTVIDINGNINTQIDFTDGDMIGLEYYQANRRTFTNDITAITDMTILLLEPFRLMNPCQNYCPRHTVLIQNAFTQLAKQNQKNINRIIELSKHTTKEKVMTYLLNVKAIKKSNEFDIPYNRQELANYLAVERTALSKELSDLQKEGKIKYNLNHFIILTK